jgi:hypothetical protein
MFSNRQALATSKCFCGADVLYERRRQRPNTLKPCSADVAVYLNIPLYKHPGSVKKELCAPTCGEEPPRYLLNSGKRNIVRGEADI